jgi:hypothetical protein
MPLNGNSPIHAGSKLIVSYGLPCGVCNTLATWPSDRAERNNEMEWNDEDGLLIESGPFAGFRFTKTTYDPVTKLHIGFIVLFERMTYLQLTTESFAPAE